MCARQWPVWCGRGPSRAIPIPRGTRAVPGWHRPGSTAPAPVGGYRSFPLLLAIPSACPESAGGAVAIRRLPRQLGGCRCGPAAADLHVCLRLMFIHIAPQACQSLRSSFPCPGRCYPACDTSPVPGAPSWWVQLGGVAQSTR